MEKAACFDAKEGEIMQKLIAVRRAHPVVYSVAAAFFSVAGLLLVGVAVQLIVLLAGAEADYYVLMLAQEALGALLIYGMLRASGCGSVLRQKGCGFWKGLYIGLYPLVLIVYAAWGTYTLTQLEGAQPAPLYHAAAFLATMGMIGLAEEMAFRGLIAGTLLEAFGTSRAGVWKATALSGVLFGVAHLSNVLGASLLGVCIQTVVASVLGMLFAAIYYRSGNLWVTIFLHAAMDTASLLGGGLFVGGTDATVAETISGYSLVNLLPVVTYLLPTVFLLRKKKLPELQALWTRPVSCESTQTGAAEPGSPA